MENNLLPCPVAYMDETGFLSKSARENIFGLWNNSCGSGQVLGVSQTYSDIADKWKKLDAEGIKASLTGLGCGIIADYDQMCWKHKEAVGSSDCPICGVNTPHHHINADIEQHQKSEKFYADFEDKKWVEAETIISRLESSHPFRSPLYAHSDLLAAQAENARLVNALSVAQTENFRITEHLNTLENIVWKLTHSLSTSDLEDEIHWEILERKKKL